MAPMNFNFVGWVFESGLDVLERSFRTAFDALENQIAKARHEEAVYLEHVQLTGESEIERDDDGIILWDKEDVLGYEIEFAEDAGMALRKAFAIAIYHHWERSIRDWTEATHRSHSDLAERAVEKGATLHEKLGAVRDLVNALKHDSKRLGNKLMKSWPAVFPVRFQPTELTDWYEAIHLTNDQVFEVIEIVRQSGPDVKVKSAVKG